MSRLSIQHSKNLHILIQITLFNVQTRSPADHASRLCVWFVRNFEIIKYPMCDLEHALDATTKELRSAYI